MKKILSLVWLSLASLTTFAQSLPFPKNGTAIPYTNLVVRWEVPTNPWPKTLWAYQTKLTKPSPTSISNLMIMGSFTEKDIDPKYPHHDTGLIFSKSGRVLNLIYLIGDIRYWIPSNYGPANLAKDVPETNQLFQLATNFLPKIGIPLSELVKDTNGLPAFYFPEAETEYYVGNTTITNIQRRIVHFSRELEGLKYDGAGGYGSVEFGEHSQVVGIWIHWPKVERDKLYAAATPEKIIQWLREDRADSGPPQAVGGIDWAAVKSVTIKQATARYAGGATFGEHKHPPTALGDVSPYATLQATIDTGATPVDIEIHCPIIDETKPLEIKP